MVSFPEFLSDFFAMIPIDKATAVDYQVTLVYTLLIIGYALAMVTIVLVFLAMLNGVRYKLRNYRFDQAYQPKFSLLVPAHNEEPVIERTIERFLKTTYSPDKKEMIIINDGSVDDTGAIAEKYAYKIVNADTGEVKYRKSPYKGIILVNRKVGGKGKAYVLNDGKKYSTGEILFFIDADVQLTENIFERVARHFADERVGAVMGYLAISEKKGKVLNKFINFEFALSQRVMRLGFDTMGIHYIIPGGCGVFRRSVMDKVGDYSADTLAEDTDMSWRVMMETGKKVHFDPSVKVMADEPTNLRSLWNQRLRWARGNFGVTIKHIRRIGNPKYGKLATLGWPFWMAQIIVPMTFFITTVGLLFNAVIGVEIDRIAIIARMLSFAFFAIWAIGVVVNRGRNWLAGLISPGFVMLTTLFANIVWPNGIDGLMHTIGYPQYTSEVSTLMLGWIIFSLFATYGMVRLSRRHPSLSNFIQLGFFGYWGVLVLSALSGYVKELKGDEKVWVRTVR